MLFFDTLFGVQNFMYIRQSGYLRIIRQSAYFKRFDTGKIDLSLVLLLTFVLLISTGVGYRVLAGRLELVTEKTVELPVPLHNFPMHVGGWEGEDVPIPENIQRVAGNDDFLNRVYINKSTNQWANIYVAYSSSPRTMLGHRPDICYVGGGWVHDITEESSFISSYGRGIDCLIHRFHMPAPRSDQVVVLNYYILNGQIVADDSGFSGVSVRAPNIGGDRAKYVAQIQISSVLENAARALAFDIADIVIKYFPDVNGVVEMADKNSGTLD